MFLGLIIRNKKQSCCGSEALMWELRGGTCIGATLLQLHPRSRYNCSSKSAILSLKALNPGSGGEIPAIWHGTGACHGHIYPKILVLKARLLVLSLYPERVACAHMTLCLDSGVSVVSTTSDSVCPACSHAQDNIVARIIARLVARILG